METMNPKALKNQTSEALKHCPICGNEWNKELLKRIRKEGVLVQKMPKGTAFLFDVKTQYKADLGAVPVKNIFGTITNVYVAYEDFDGTLKYYDYPNYSENDVRRMRKEYERGKAQKIDMRYERAVAKARMREERERENREKRRERLEKKFVGVSNAALEREDERRDILGKAMIVALTIVIVAVFICCSVFCISIIQSTIGSIIGGLAIGAAIVAVWQSACTPIAEWSAEPSDELEFRSER